MEGKLSAFERRMKILSVLVNGKLISRLELSRWFDVSDVTINPSLTLPKKERTENKLKKSRFYADFFELFLLTNTENYDIIYLI